MVKNPPASAGDKDSIPGSGRSMEKEMSTHSSIHAWKTPIDSRAWLATVHGVTKSQIRHSDLNNKIPNKAFKRACMKLTSFN